MFKVPEQHRANFPKSHPYYSDESFGNNGVFYFKDDREILFKVIASDGLGWEHISITLVEWERTPTWKEMCFVKSIFWSDEDAVIQIHPPKEDHINCHPFCLHLWRPVDAVLPLPPSIMVAPKGEIYG